MAGVEPVKLVVAALWSERTALDRALERLEERFGEVDFRGPDRPFDASDYYAEEMGERLWRTLLSHRELVAAERLVELKLSAMEVEDELRRPAGRAVNLDVGYLDRDKLVLASTKHLGQKVYLGGGVSADLVLRFRDGRYRPLEWTFPDFRDGRYDEELLEIRRRYRAEL